MCHPNIWASAFYRGPTLATLCIIRRSCGCINLPPALHQSLRTEQLTRTLAMLQDQDQGPHRTLKCSWHCLFNVTRYRWCYVHVTLRSPHCIEQLVILLSRYSKTIEQASDYWRILSIATVLGIADVMFMWHWGALTALPAPVSTVWKRFLKQKIHLLSHCDRSSSLSLASLERDKNRNSLSHQGPGTGL